MLKLPTQLRPLSKLKLWEDNYRRGDVDAIARSIREFGMNGIPRVWGETVMAGNHAVKALIAIKEAGGPLPKRGARPDVRQSRHSENSR